MSSILVGCRHVASYCCVKNEQYERMVGSLVLRLFGHAQRKLIEAPVRESTRWKKVQ